MVLRKKYDRREAMLQLSTARILPSLPAGTGST
jgi:hypothetical protein